jgi:uncharacterized membrane protein
VTRRGRLIVFVLVLAALAVGGIAAAVVLLTRDGPAEAERPANATGGYLAESASEAGEEEDEEDVGDLLLARYRQRSFPEERVGFAQTVAARRSFAALPLRVPAAQGRRASSALSLSAKWRSLGPTVARALPQAFGNYEVRSGTVSGRVTSLLLGRRCVPGDCRLWVGTAGGGVFRTNDALAAEPVWESKSSGLTSSAIGFLARDPGDETGRTIYAGTGEEHAAADSEAGVGVFRSTDGGDSWSILAGSPAVAGNVAVSGIVVDPRRPQTIYISTAVSAHGSSSVFGGAAIPPGAPAHGVYLSVDGGASFSLVHSAPGRFGTRSIDGIELDPNDPDTIYAAVDGEGLLRRSQRLDGDADFHRVFEFRGVEAGDESRVVFALADLGSSTRIYAGSANPSGDGVANLYRTDDAGLPAADVRASWTLLSSSEPGTPGFASYRYCGVQCWYGNVVVTPPGQPDVVWLGGNYEYGEARRGQTAGRAILRSTDAGASFNDLTSDARTPRFEMHPDQHAIVFSPSDPDVAFVGSDGGVVRLSGEYASVAGRCPASHEFLTWCEQLLGRVPTQIDDLNAGLDTLQLQSVSLSSNPQVRDLLMGTQDNGTWSYNPERGWSNIQGGDGGQSGIDARDPRIRFHTYFSQYVEINHSSGDPAAWRSIDAPLWASQEHVSFYAPIITDPRVGGTMFIGLQRVWRTKQSGGPRDGDWVPLGADLTGTSYGADRREECDGANAVYYCFVAAVERAPGDTSTLWAATFHGRVFVSRNADGPAESVTFARVDVPTGTPGKLSTPGRFVSGIAIDPTNPNHAWISYSGYAAYTPEDERGHVFEVVFDPGTGSATWTNRSYNLEDEPITDIARDPTTGDLYASTDFGVARLPAGATAWTEAAEGLPFVAVYGVTISPDGQTLYAATHGRGLWALELR